MHSNASTLRTVIEMAIKGGWKYQPFGERYFPDYLDDEALVIHIADTINDLRLYAVIFNHDFARALFGEESWRTHEGNGVEIITTGYPAWRYHLQSMVFAPDPIAYLREWVEGQART